MIHCTLDKKGFPPSACKQMDGRGAQMTSPVKVSDPVLCNLYFNLKTKTFLLSLFRICAFHHSLCRRRSSVSFEDAPLCVGVCSLEILHKATENMGFDKLH